MKAGRFEKSFKKNIGVYNNKSEMVPDNGTFNVTRAEKIDMDAWHVY